MGNFRIICLGSAAVLAAGALLAGLSQARSSADGAVITNSGSTNTRPYTIAVRADGTAAVSSGGSTSAARLAGGLALKFLTDARAAKAQNPRGGAPCMKSASFGSRTTVSYHGWRSPDLGCPTEGILAVLADDVQAISAAVGAGGHHVNGAPIPATSP